MSSRFSIIRVLIILATTIASPLLPYGIITGTKLNMSVKLGWSIFLGLIIIAAVIIIWNQFLNRMNKIQLQGNSLKFKNIITRKEKQLHISEIKDIKHSKWTDTVDFVTSKQKIRVVSENYRNLNELIGKIKTLSSNLHIS
jgi:hypothetical protein